MFFKKKETTPEPEFPVGTFRIKAIPVSYYSINPSFYYCVEVYRFDKIEEKFIWDEWQVLTDTEEGSVRKTQVFISVNQAEKAYRNFRNDKEKLYSRITKWNDQKPIVFEK